MKSNRYSNWKIKKRNAGKWDCCPVERDEGKVAFLNGHDLASNPYHEKGEKKREWQRGWKIARNAKDRNRLDRIGV